MVASRWVRQSKQMGFTVVELLIVVVIIAILATVTIISYVGAQTRGENAKTVQTVNQYLKAITLYATQNNLYPVATTWPCLGATASCAKMSGATSCFGVGSAVTNAAFNTTIQPILGAIPEPSAQTMNCAGNSYKGAFYNKNDTSGGKSAQVYYFLRGNQQCNTPYGIATKQQQDDTTLCVVNLPTLP